MLESYVIFLGSLTVFGCSFFPEFYEFPFFRMLFCVIGIVGMSAVILSIIGLI